MADLTDADELADPAVLLVAEWLERAKALESRLDRKATDQLKGVIVNPAGVEFVMQFVDRVARPHNDAVAARQLVALVRDRSLPSFLGAVDRALLGLGARLAPHAPRVVMPLARRRMRSIVGHMVAPADDRALAVHLGAQRDRGFDVNVNLLGEAVLGEGEARHRLDDLLNLLEQPNIDYVSVKISAVASQLNYWAHDDSLRRVSDRLRILVDRAASVEPRTFVNFDMEEYHDLELTLAAFMAVLGEPERRHVDAGIVLQAYLPDVLPALQRLVAWANQRHQAGGGVVKVRLVKGANLAMERVDAAVHGWEQAPYETKVETDANYKRCLDWLLRPDRMGGVRLGLASHNLFDVAWTILLAEARGVSDRVQFEMLQGMAPAHAAAVQERTSSADKAMLLYTPVVPKADFDVAISYLFRRLEENASADNFMRHLFDLDVGSQAFDTQEQIFRSALEMRNTVATGPRRTQNRAVAATAPYNLGEPFVNEPDTDPTLLSNQRWIADVSAAGPVPAETPVTRSVAAIDAIIAKARAAQASWVGLGSAHRQQVLHRVGAELVCRRGELISTMMHEANKTMAEADVEVSEAIDFARWYGDRSIELDQNPLATFTPFGVIAVVPPWNFPVAIPAGGVLAALAAGNAAVLKPAPETPRCAEVVAQACWAAGVPTDVLLFVQTPEDEVGQRLITAADAVILTGAAETADLFRSWKPDMRLFAETSGKNAMIITPHADLDLAVEDLVASAFGHGGQKCSAASLAILVGDVYESARFRRQLIDAVEGIEVGPAGRIETMMGPLAGTTTDRLLRGLTTLEVGETWLVQPALLDDEAGLWSPGVRDGVVPGSWFHRTECFGPVLGLVHAKDLDDAIRIQNSSAFGLTGGVHSLDPVEVDSWVANVEVGNAYVNRAITGAIVQRQPFGGWKRSSVGPGAKAGGPNYVAQLGTWQPILPEGAVDRDDYGQQWDDHFAVAHDPTSLFCEANIFRYRPLARVLLRCGEGASSEELARVRWAAATCGVGLVESDSGQETEGALAARLSSLDVQRMRVVGTTVGETLRNAAHGHGVHLADGAVTASGRVELQHYVREQAVSKTLHRFGNLVAAVPRPGGLVSSRVAR